MPRQQVIRSQYMFAAEAPVNAVNNLQRLSNASKQKIEAMEPKIAANRANIETLQDEIAALKREMEALKAAFAQKENVDDAGTMDGVEKNIKIEKQEEN